MHYRTDFIGNKVEFLSTKKKDEIKEEKQDRNSIFEEFGDNIKTESKIGEQIEITDKDLSMFDNEDIDTSLELPF